MDQTTIAAPRRRRRPERVPNKTQEELFAYQQSRSQYYGNKDYKMIMPDCGTWQEAYDRLSGLASEYRAKADDWRNKVYKKCGRSVEVGGKYDDFDARRVSIDYINERRKENMARNCERSAEELEILAERLKDYCTSLRDTF